MKKFYLTMFLVVISLLVGSVLAEDEQARFFILGKGGGSISGNSTVTINNFTNNITTIIYNNTVSNYTLANTSFACSDADSYVYNYSILNGVATGVCATDSTGLTVESDPLAIPRLNTLNQSIQNIEANTTKWEQAYSWGNHALAGYGLQANFVIQNTSTWATLNAKWSYSDAVVQNSSIWTAIGLRALQTDFISQANALQLNISSVNGTFTSIHTLLQALQSNISSVNDSSRVRANNLQLNITSVNNTFTTIHTLLQALQANITSVNASIVPGASQFSNDTQNLSVSGYDVKTTGHFYQHGVLVRDFNAWFCDFMSGTYDVGACSPDYYGYVLGTAGISAPSVNTVNYTIGQWSISRGTGAASGYAWITNISAFSMIGKEVFSTQINITSPLIRNKTMGILGFCDAVTLTTTCTDGVYFNITGNITFGLNARGVVRNGAGINMSGTDVNLTYGKFYIYKIMTLNLTQSTFEIWDSVLNTRAFYQSINSSIPQSAGRETGAGIWLGEDLAGAAGIRAYVDYVLTEVERSGRFR